MRDSFGTRLGRVATALAGYGLTGAAAFALLAVIEWVDLNFRLGPVLESFGDRLALGMFLSVSVAIGLLLGLTVGLVALIGSGFVGLCARALALGGRTRRWHRAIAFVITLAAGVAILIRQRPVRYYLISLLREAEKLEALTDFVFKREKGFAIALLTLGLVCCWVVWRLTRASAAMRPILTAWLALLALVAAAGYYADSRFHSQLYEYSYHRSLYLLVAAVSIALVGAVGIAWKRLSRGRSKLLRPGWLAWASVALAAMLAFTFARLPQNQSLKTQIHSRSTHARQNYKLATWLLDFDRDGYASALGGGDSNNNDRSISPGSGERLEDSVDNNCIGGDLSASHISYWNQTMRVEGPPDPNARRHNVLFFFIDALRPDRLGCYGYGRATSPNIDRLASRASLFENAYSSAPFTFEAVPRFMQSSYWDGNFPAWTHVLKQNGYRAVGVRSPRLLRRYVKGVDSKQSKREKNTESAMDVLIEAFESTPRSTPFLGFMHVPDPHWVYAPHSEFNFGESDSDRYDGEIAYADHHIGRLLNWLETTGRLEETIIVITSDHGESFGERGVYLHGTQLYDEQMRAPIIIHVPGQPARRIGDYVSTIDLGTTILSLVGISPPAEYIGVSLGPLMRGEPFAHPPVFGEHNYREVSRLVPYEANLNPERRTYMVITQDGYKLIYHREWYGFELFDLKNDPRETRNLYDRMPEKADELKQLLGRFVDVVTASRPKDSDERRFPAGNQREEDDEVEQD